MHFHLEYVVTLFLCQPADNLDTGACEDFLGVGGVGKFAAQVLSGEMQIAVQLAAPIRAFAYVVDNAIVGDPFFVGVVAIMA